MKTFGILFLAILSEVIATTSLKLSEGFTKLIPSVVAVIGYCFPSLPHIDVKQSTGHAPTTHKIVIQGSAV